MKWYFTKHLSSNFELLIHSNKNQMKKSILSRNTIAQVVITYFKALLSYTILLLFIAALPGISTCQCPSSYNGYMTSDQTNATNCGFRQIEAAINLNGVSTFDGWGRMNVVFSNNVKILGTPTALKTYIKDISVLSDYEVTFKLGPVCEDVYSITDDDHLIRIIYTLLSGTSATAETYFTRLAYGCFNSCSNYSEAADITIDVDPFELNGNVIAPGEFSCSGGSSTDHGLPDRNINVSMINSPYWNSCEDVPTDGYGYYECNELWEDCTYKICVTGPNDDYCGIDEFDIDVIRDHILNYECFEYEWQFFSADADNNGLINTEDLAHLNLYLIDDPPFGIPLKWKYVSNSQFDNFSPSTCDYYVPVVDNCSNITINNDPTIEDWYGFPTGDVNHTCTTCGLRKTPDIYNRSVIYSKSLKLSNEGNNSILISFDHPVPVNLWSMALKPDISVDFIKSIYLQNTNSNGFSWNIDRENNIVKLIFTEFQRIDLLHFMIHIELKENVQESALNWSIYTGDLKVHNILIDKYKNYYTWNVNLEPSSEIFIYPNPAENILCLPRINLNFNEIFLYNSNGKLIQNQKLSSTNLDVSTLLPGMYIIRYKDENLDKILRFIKSK